MGFFFFVFFGGLGGLLRCFDFYLRNCQHSMLDHSWFIQSQEKKQLMLISTRSIITQIVWAVFSVSNCRIRVTDCWFYSKKHSSSCYPASTDLVDPLSPPVSTNLYRYRAVVYRFCIGTDMLYIGSSWPSCLCSSMWRGPREYIAYELILTSLAVSRMSASSNLDSFRNG